MGRFLYAFWAQQVAVFGILFYKVRHGGAGSNDLLADAPGVVKRGLNQRRGQSLATESIFNDRVVELAGRAGIYVVARARLDAVHGKDVTGLIGLVCNSVFHVPILSKNGPSYEEPLLWPEPGSNWRPHTFQACALPTELSGQKPEGFGDLDGT